MAKKDF